MVLHSVSSLFYNLTKQPALIFQRRSPTPHFGGAHSVVRTPNFELGRDFCTVHLLPSFIILCLLVRKLSCWQTYKHINKQMKTSHTPCYATTLG